MKATEVTLPIETVSALSVELLLAERRFEEMGERAWEDDEKLCEARQSIERVRHLQARLQQATANV